MILQAKPITGPIPKTSLSNSKPSLIDPIASLIGEKHCGLCQGSIIQGKEGSSRENEKIEAKNSKA